MEYSHLSNSLSDSELPSTLGHLLVVEDDSAAAFVLAAALKFGGFDCDVAGTAVDALGLVRGGSYDAVLLDLGLPDLEGQQLIKTLRFHCTVPIIVVSGRDTEEEKVSALDAGADDFVAKPYAPSELLARIRAVLRRGSKPEPVEQARAPLETAQAVDQPEQIDRLLGIYASLRPQEQSVWDLLVAGSGDVVKVEDLVAELWPDDQARGIGNLRVIINSIRGKLAAEQAPLKIENVRGVGYRASKL